MYSNCGTPIHFTGLENFVATCSTCFNWESHDPSDLAQKCLPPSALEPCGRWHPPRCQHFQASTSKLRQIASHGASLGKKINFQSCGLTKTYMIASILLDICHFVSRSSTFKSFYIYIYIYISPFKRWYTFFVDLLVTPLVIPLVESAWYPCQSYQTKELKYIAIFCCEHGSFEEILKSCGPFVTIVHKIERPSLAHIKGNRKKSTSVFTCVTRKHWHLWGGGRIASAPPTVHLVQHF